ncbi:MAG: 2-isopropylmalate synthase [Christensenellales bacterium]|jgi:2-isopropylmalate synthase
MDKIRIFDTTLRDGEQAPGCSMNLNDKLKVAEHLELLNVDVIEAGFAIASEGDFQSVKAISEKINNVTVASLSRALTLDIDRAWEAVKGAKSPMIHTFIATSDIHLQYKLKMTREEVLEHTAKMVAYARNLCPNVEFSAEDASRSDREYLAKVIETAIKSGAQVVNIPDTVGYATPESYSDLIRYLVNNVPNIDKAIISTHCHNDLGLAVANSLAAVKAGARQVECTINGLGERAGNAALEEIVMALKTRRDEYGAETSINTDRIYAASRMVTLATGKMVQINKAIVGENAFAHEAGIHQHGIMANRETYEIMRPEDIGLPKSRMVLGKHSGKHAVEERLKEMGFNFSKEEINEIFIKFKDLADRKKIIDDRDIEVLAMAKGEPDTMHFTLDRFVINSGDSITATANIRLKVGGEKREDVAVGDGPVGAAFRALEKLTGIEFKLESYHISAVTEGEDAIGMADVRLNVDGRSYHGRGASTDIVDSSIRACLNALNSAYSYAKSLEN